MQPKFLCSSCGAELRRGQDACPACGVSVEWSDAAASASKADEVTCSVCGAVSKAGTPTCPECGSALKGGRSPKKDRPQPRQRKGAATQAGGARWFSTWQFPLLVITGIVAAAGYLIFRMEHKPVENTGEERRSMNAPNMAAMNQMREFEAQLERAPNDAQTRVRYANFLQDNGFFDKAIVQYTQYLAAVPSDVNARIDLGICYKENGDLAAARKQMEAGLAVNPNHALGHFNLGIVLLALGETQEAVRELQTSLTLSPPSDVAERARTLIQQHQTN